MRMGIGMTAPLLALALTVSQCALRASGAGSSPARLRVGYIGPDFALPDMAGRVWQLRQLHGSPVILLFVCGCQRCCRLLGAFARRPLPRGHTLAISSLAPTDIQALMVRSNCHFPGLFDPFSKVATAYGAIECPRVWALDRQQVVRYVSSSDAVSPDEIVRRAIGAVRTESPVAGRYRPR